MGGWGEPQTPRAGRSGCAVEGCRAQVTHVHKVTADLAGAKVDTLIGLCGPHEHALGWAPRHGDFSIDTTRMPDGAWPIIEYHVSLEIAGKLAVPELEAGLRAWAESEARARGLLPVADATVAWAASDDQFLRNCISGIGSVRCLQPPAGLIEQAARGNPTVRIPITEGAPSS